MSGGCNACLCCCRVPQQQATYPRIDLTPDQVRSADLAASASRAGPQQAALGTAGSPHQPSSSGSAVGPPPGLGLPPQAQQPGAGNHGVNGQSSQVKLVHVAMWCCNAELSMMKGATRALSVRAAVGPQNNKQTCIFRIEPEFRRLWEVTLLSYRMQTRCCSLYHLGHIPNGTSSTAFPCCCFAKQQICRKLCVSVHDPKAHSQYPNSL